MSDWTSELPALAALSDADAAAAINAMTVQQTIMVFGSFRTLQWLLTIAEYNAIKTTLLALAAQEKAAGGSFINDAIMFLNMPGDATGNGGGINFGDASFIANLQAVSAQANTPSVPAKVAAYVASQQPAPQPKYPWVRPGDVIRVRAGGPA